MIKQIEQIITNTKINSLWEHEASLRKKLKLIAEIEKIFNKKRNSTKQKEANKLYKNYEELLNYVSERLLSDYNRKNNADHKLEEISMQWALKFASGPPLAYARTKKLFFDALDTSFERHLEVERQMQIKSAESEDYKVGVNALMNKEEPNFIGK